MRKYVIEKSPNRRGYAEVYKMNEKKGFYNFVSYVRFEDLQKYKADLFADVIIDKTMAH